MGKRLIKILIFILIFCFTPVNTFGFFAEPDPYIYSMPFGARGNNSGIQPSIPGILNLDSGQSEWSQNYLYENSDNNPETLEEINQDNFYSNGSLQNVVLSVAVITIFVTIVVLFLALIFLSIRKTRD